MRIDPLIESSHVRDLESQIFKFTDRQRAFFLPICVLLFFNKKAMKSKDTFVQFLNKAVERHPP